MPIPPRTSLRHTGFSLMAKPLGPFCNLDCRYCYYLEKEKLYPQTPRSLKGFSISDEVLEAYVRQTFEATRAPVVSFMWQGGEPTLLGRGFFQRVVELERRYAGGRRFENALQTNGVLVDDAWCELFREHDFLVGLSVDGPPAIHDRYRVDRGGAPTSSKTIAAAARMKKHGVSFNTLTVVHEGNEAHPLEVYRFLRDLGSGHMQFIPIVERMASVPASDGLALVTPRREQAAEVTPWSVTADGYGRFLCSVFDEWVRHDVGRVYVQLFEVTLQAYLHGEPSLCVFQPTCGKALVMEHNGDVYACDHFVYPEHRLGNIMDQPLSTLVRLPQQQAFGDDKQRCLTEHCRQCDYLFVCNGECPKHRFATSPSGEAGHNYLCAAYQTFFSHAAPYMEFMARELEAERPPANVMGFARDRDQAARAAGPRVYRSPSRRKGRARGRG